MHILDVISSVSGSSKCTQIVGGWGFARDPTGATYIQALPQIPLEVRALGVCPLIH